MSAPSVAHPAPFFGPSVVRGAFALAVFGWGVGFYGPSVFLHEVVARTGWPLALVSSAVTAHFLFGALVITRLPRWHRRFGVGPTAVAGAAITALGVAGWATAAQPWQLFVSTLASGGGWVTMGAVAVNAAIAPWYERGRPQALASAYNGASIGGVIFSPLWAVLITALGFASAAAAVGLLMVLAMALVARTVFAVSPQQLGQRADGDDARPAWPEAGLTSKAPLRHPWRERRFLTLALAMSIGLFAQIGLIAHLYSLLAAPFGPRAAGAIMGFATACAVGGRLLVARALAPGVDRRKAAAAAYLVQLTGSIVLLAAGPDRLALTLLGAALFGSGIGNATSLPPLIAQAEFDAHDVARAVALIVALAQATYAFAPAAFGAILAAAAVDTTAAIGRGSAPLFIAAAALQATAIACLLAGRRRA